MDIRMIVSDIDGTLVDGDERLAQSLLDAARRLREKQIPFTLATGRSFALTYPFVEKLAIVAPYVTCNGACLFQGKTCVQAHTFSIAPVLHLLRRADQYGMTVTVSDAYEEMPVRVTPYVEKQRSLGERLTRQIDLDSASLASDRYVKVMIFDQERSENLARLSEDIEPYRDLYAITRFSNRAIELGPPGITKASGVYALAAWMDIPLEKVMALGDYVNDVEMLSLVGCGVAVGNALDAVKAAARHVVSGSCGDGVAEAINAFCLNVQSKGE